MQKIKSILTVYFEDPFWVGIYERILEETLEVCKITFGSEPKDYEVYDFLLKNWNNLKFSPSIKTDAKQEIKINPKRMRRAIKKQVESQSIGTKSQQALKLQQEEKKTSQKQRSRKRKEDEKQHQFELRKQKRKDKHRGK